MRMSSIMYRSEQSQREGTKKKSKLRMIRSEVKANETPIQRCNKDQLLCKRQYRETRQKKTKTRTLYARKKAERQRVMAPFALPRE